jgi:hypothetical protein
MNLTESSLRMGTHKELCFVNSQSSLRNCFLFLSNQERNQALNNIIMNNIIFHINKLFHPHLSLVSLSKKILNNF